MRLPLLAAALTMAAALLQFGLAQPLRVRALAAREEYRKVRDERYARRATLSELERRQQATRRAVALVASSWTSPDDAVRRVRREVVQALDAAGLHAARLSVRPGRGRSAAAVKVASSGSAERVLRLPSRMAEPGRGMVLTTVRLARAGRGEASVDVEALGFPGTSP